MQNAKQLSSWNSILKFFILLGFCLLIASDEVVSHYVLMALHDQGAYILVGLFCIQLLAAPIQAGFSDAWCRKRTLMLAVIISTISCSLITLFIIKSSKGEANAFLFLYAAAFLKFSLGNMIPVCRAGIVDFFVDKGFRFVIGISTISIAQGYFSFHETHDISNIMLIFSIVLLSILIFFAIFLHDSADQKKQSDPDYKNANFWNKIKHETKNIEENFFSNFKFLKTISAYIMWEIAFYLIFFLSVDFSFLPEISSKLMIIGYVLGVLSLTTLSRMNDTHILSSGITISAICSIILFLDSTVFPDLIDHDLLKFFITGLFALGYGLIVPCMFSMLTSNYKDLHSQGKLYGLIESGDHVAFISAFFIDKIFIYNSIPEYSFFILSLLFFILGIIFIKSILLPTKS